MKIRAFTGGGFGENTYLVICGNSSAAVVIDPGAAASEVVPQIQDEGLDLHAILLTHAHLDHIEGVSEIRAISPDVPIWLHADDRELYEVAPFQAQMFGMTATPQPPPTNELIAGQRYEFDSCALDVRFTPGHSPGHVIFVAPDESFALVGDVVFSGSIGRTDLPGGDMGTLMDSIREQVLTLPDETELFTGHGPLTTVGQERRTNPFLTQHYGGGQV